VSQTIIQELLDSDDDVPQKVVNKVVLAALGEIKSELQRLTAIEESRKTEVNYEHGRFKERIETLEQKNVVMWVQEHPKGFSILVVAVLVLLNLWFVSDFRHAILPLLGLPANLITP